MKRLAVIGAGGHANEFAELSGLDFDIFVDREWLKDGLLPLDEFDPQIWKAIVCVGDSKARKRLVDRLPKQTEYFTFIHPSSLVGRDVHIGEGSYVGPGCIITTNARIGKHALLNRIVQVSHDCVIGDFFSAMPGTTISGNCTIGDEVYTGCNSSIRERVTVGNGVTIGMGGALVADAPTPGVYVGVPAKRKAKLSIVIPCYNFQSYLSTAIESALSQQTEFDVQVLVGDDCSTDGTSDVIKRYEGKIDYYVNETNIGPLRNIRKLLDAASGEYISYLDGDDYFTDPLKSQKQVDFLDANPDYSMHSTGCVYGEEDGTPTDVNVYPLVEDVNTTDLLNMNLVGFGRTFRNSGNIIKKWMERAYYLDWCTNVEISLKGKIKCESWQSGVYRLTGKGMITSKSQDEIDKLNVSNRNAISERVKYHIYE